MWDDDDEEPANEDGDNESKKQTKREELLPEVSALLPSKMGDSMAVTRAHGIQMIMALPKVKRDRLYKSNKLIQGLPNMNAKSDALKMVDEAGYDIETVKSSQKKAKELKSTAGMIRQEVNAAILTSNDCLRALALLEQSDKAGELDGELKRTMEDRAMTNVMIQSQRLVRVGEEPAAHLTTGLSVTSAAPKRPYMWLDAHTLGVCM